jgi:hypothetical protein
MNHFVMYNSDIVILCENEKIHIPGRIYKFYGFLGLTTFVISAGFLIRLTQAFKIIHKTVPSYLSDLITEKAYKFRGAITLE